MKKGSLSVIVVFLALLNVWLLYTNNERQHQIEKLSELKNPNILSFESQALKSWGYETIGNKPAKVIHPSVEIPKRGMSMVVLFTDRGCSYCVNHEVGLLNNLYDKFEGEFKVYLMSHNKSFLERLHKAEFPYSTIDPQKKLMDNAFEFSNPVVLFVDKVGLVQIVHIAEKDNELKSTHFYSRIESLLSSLKG